MGRRGVVRPKRSRHLACPNGVEQRPHSAGLACCPVDPQERAPRLALGWHAQAAGRQGKLAMNEPLLRRTAPGYCRIKPGCRKRRRTERPARRHRPWHDWLLRGSCRAFRHVSPLLSEPCLTGELRLDVFYPVDDRLLVALKEAGRLRLKAHHKNRLRV